MKNLKTVVDYWQQQYWLNVVGAQTILGIDGGLALYSGADAVEYAGPEVATNTVTGDTVTSNTKSVVQDAVPAAKVVGDYDHLVICDPALLIVLSDHARFLGLSPVIWAGAVAGGSEIRFSVEG